MNKNHIYNIDNSRNYKYPRASMQSLRNYSKMLSSKDGEEWLFEAQARYNKEFFNTIPGFISLTNKRLVFEPAITSVINSSILDIDLKHISNIKKTSGLIFLPNSFKVYINDGKSYSFTTWKRDFIISILNKFL